MVTASTVKMRALSAAEAASRLGTTVKALRVYEAAGLVRPDRSANGWRRYDRSHLEQLQQVLALKELGLPLKRIAALMQKPGTGMAATLAIQEAAILKDLALIEQRLACVRAAREKIAAGATLTIEEVGNLARGSASPPPLSAQEIEARVKQLVSETDASQVADEIAAAIKDCLDRPEDYPKLEADMVDLLAEAGLIAGEHGPESPRAQALADRWLGLTNTILVDERSLKHAFDGFEPKLTNLAGALHSDQRLGPGMALLRAAVGLALERRLCDAGGEP